MTLKDKQKYKKIKEKSPVSYRNLEQVWGRQRYIDQRNLNTKISLTWFRLGTQTLRGKAQNKEDVPFVTKKKMWFIYF
jgi:hypothetical protein